MGEFKKRIILMTGEGKYDPQRVEYLGKVSDMIEEAKKEFPFWIPRTQARAIYYAQKKEEHFPIRDTEEIADKLYEWFLKWFGEKEAET